LQRTLISQFVRPFRGRAGPKHLVEAVSNPLHRIARPLYADLVSKDQSAFPGALRGIVQPDFSYKVIRDLFIENGCARS